MSEDSIAFIIPYCGLWPFWLPLFLKSCRFNPRVNWGLYSDGDQPDDLPANVRYGRISFAESCQLVSRWLGFELSPQRADKRRGLKPALSHVHMTDIKGFDFWCFSDIDVVCDLLRDYFTVKRLACFDFCSTQERGVFGHLCLTRKNKRIGTAFMNIPDFQPRLWEERILALDEGAFTPIFSAYWYWRHDVLTTSNGRARSFPYFHFYGLRKWYWGDMFGPDTGQIVGVLAHDEGLIDAQRFHVLPERQAVKQRLAA